jgi:hypothetical protein
MSDVGSKQTSKIKLSLLLVTDAVEKGLVIFGEQ